MLSFNKKIISIFIFIFILNLLFSISLQIEIIYILAKVDKLNTRLQPNPISKANFAMASQHEE